MAALVGLKLGIMVARSLKNCAVCLKSFSSAVGFFCFPGGVRLQLQSEISDFRSQRVKYNY